MKSTKARERAAASPLLRRMLSDYVPISALWTGQHTPYASEQSARWSIRQHRQQLVDAGALALDRGRLLVQPELFVQVVERAAIEAVQRRVNITSNPA
jgi:hypothetical protein